MQKSHDWRISYKIHGLVSPVMCSLSQKCRTMTPNQLRCMVAWILQWLANRGNSHPRQRRLNSLQLITQDRKSKSQPRLLVPLSINELQIPYWIRIQRITKILCSQGIKTIPIRMLKMQTPTSFRSSLKQQNQLKTGIPSCKEQRSLQNHPH